MGLLHVDQQCNSFLLFHYCFYKDLESELAQVFLNAADTLGAAF